MRANLKPSARELFPVLRERLLASRPVIQPERVVSYPEVVRATTRKRRADPEFEEYVRWHSRSISAVFGSPTFRNAIDENGKHV